MSNKILELEGYTNDLLMRSNDNSVMSTRLVYFTDEENLSYNKDVLDICFTSSNNGIDKAHNVFNQILDKKIKMTIEIV